MPVSETASGELEASLVTVKVPDDAPDEVGANWICAVTLWPTPIEVARLPPVMVNPAPEMVAEETLTAAVPVFVMLKLCVALLPTATLPNETVVALGESTPGPDPPD